MRPALHITLARIAAVALAFAAATAGAQTGAPGPVVTPQTLANLTLQEAETLFNARNREIQLARRTTEGAEADILSAAARPNPTLSIGTASFSPSVGIGPGSLRDKRLDTTLGVTQLFERGGKRELRTQAAQFNAAAARSDEADVVRQQRAALYTAYYDLVLAQHRITVTEDTAHLFNRTVDAARERVKAGDISPTELARINVDALRAQNDARAARADRDKAQLALAYLVGAEQQAAKLRAADDWPRVEPQLDRSRIEQVLAQRPDIRAAQARMQSAEKNTELARSLRTRDVVAGVQYEHYPTDASNNSYGVSVSIPLFTSYYYQGEIRRAEVELTAAQENLDRTRALALADIDRAVADLTSAADRLRRFRESLLASAEKAASGAEFAYSRGAIGVMDLLDARRQLYATRLEAIGAQADYARALAAWQAATSVQQP
jgi:cobalt-zinc-cadmium efflux system outer membrane protein